MKILLAAGGTGGHIFPGIAVAKELQERGAQVIWIGRKDSMEENLALKEGIKFFPIPASGLLGKRIWERVKFLYRLLIAVVLCTRIFIKEKPEGVLGAGGYPQIAPLLLAILFKTPIFLLEQNRIPGRVTRYFSSIAKEIYGGFPIKGKVPSFYWTGNPLRREIVEAKGKGDKILILGGSQGSKRLNYETLSLASKFPGIEFILVSGARDYEEIKRLNRYPNLSLVRFTPNPGELYSKARLIISRAGGLAISEILSLRLPSILIPFPYAADDHQKANARWTTERGASIFLDEKDIHKLKEIIPELLRDKKGLRKISQRAGELSKPKASEEIAERMMRCLQK